MLQALIESIVNYALHRADHIVVSFTDCGEVLVFTSDACAKYTTVMIKFQDTVVANTAVVGASRPAHAMSQQPLTHTVPRTSARFVFKCS